MNPPLTYQNFLDRLAEYIPEFDGPKEEKGNPIVYYNLLVGFLVDNADNSKIMRQAALLANEMVETDDIDLKMLVSDFFVNICCRLGEYNIPETLITSYLSERALAAYHRNVALWLKQNDDPRHLSYQ